MPALFAHELFGREVAKQLPEPLNTIVTAHFTEFRIGLQGPDLFFFYRPYKSNAVTRYGNHLHEIPAKPFFLHGLSVVHEKGRESQEYAYLLGFLCHFVLDSFCHPYVAQAMADTGIAHLEIEEELEKALIRQSGRDPFTFRLDRLVPTDEATARSIVPFYETDLPTVRTSLRWLRLVKRLFYAPRLPKETFLKAVMKAVGKYDSMGGLVLHHQDNPKCSESTDKLLSLFRHAIPEVVRLAENLDGCILDGGVLDPRFDRTFE